MKCFCDINAFSFTKFHLVNDVPSKTIVYRCGYNGDNKKKKNCNFKSETFIEEFTPVQSVSKNIPDDIPSKNLVPELFNLIKKFENNEYKNSLHNISENINYIISLMGYRSFIKENETINNLKKRLNGPPDKCKIIINKKFKLLDIPDNIRLKDVSNKPKIKKSNKCVKKKDVLYNNYEDESEEYLEEKDVVHKNSENSSDDDSDEELDEDPFDQNELDSDIENYNSDGGNFSD